MTAIQLKDIPGVMVEKSWCECIGNCNHENKGYNQCRTQQGQVKITLSREGLAKTLFICDWHPPMPQWECIPQDLREDYYVRADAIRSNLKDLIEVQE